MTRARIIETKEGIQEEATVAHFDVMQRGFRDKGILETKEIVKSGIDSGLAVEIGPGPGYLGFEWLSSTQGTKLIGIEISGEMIRMAEKNRGDYELEERAEYRLGNAMKMPVDDASADAVFSNGSLHEWENPFAVITEAHRVLKPGGRLFVSDLKRNLNPLFLMLMKTMTQSRVMKAGLVSSVLAAYTAEELRRLMEWSPFFPESEVTSGPFGLAVKARKAA